MVIFNWRLSIVHSAIDTSFFSASQTLCQWCTKRILFNKANTFLYLNESILFLNGLLLHLANIFFFIAKQLYFNRKGRGFHCHCHHLKTGWLIIKWPFLHQWIRWQADKSSDERSFFDKCLFRPNKSKVNLQLLCLSFRVLYLESCLNKLTTTQRNAPIKVFYW